MGYDSNTKQVYVSNLNTSGTECTLYYDETELLKEAILSNRTVQTRSFPITTSTTVTGTNGLGDIYSATDDDGTTYYFAGNPDDNWVSFANQYWRIIRINGNGSIRLIYSGDSESGPSTTGTDTQYITSRFNNSYSASYYVGLKYSNSQHGNDTNSAILEVLDTWYEDNIDGTQYEQYISTETGFCGDREMENGYSWSAIPSSSIYYAGYGRLIRNTNSVTPTFECTNSSDYYTVSGASSGNRALTYPIGLITADEAVFGGLAYSEATTDNYLYTGQDYWTMTPLYFNTYNTYPARVFFVYSLGNLNPPSLLTTYGVRPVLNLDANVEITGSGTSTDPYTVVGI